MTDWPAFIRANTRLIAPPLVPEIVLHLAEESLPIWRRTEEELAEINVPPPYWAFAWAGGQALGRYILDNPQCVRGRKVLDFGAGSGMVAIAAALAGAFDVIANDIDPVAAEAMGLNAELNDVFLDVVTQNVIGSTCSDYEVVLVGDVFYDKEIADHVLPWLRDLKARGREILIGDPGRFYLPDLGLERIARYHSETTGLMEDTDLRNAGVWRLAG